MSRRGVDRDRHGLRALYHDSRPFVWIGGAFLVLGLMFFVVVRSSPGGWQWYGATAVRGTEQGGIVYYTYHGSNYTVQDPEGISNVRVHRTVYINPSNPNVAVLTVAVPEISDSLFVGLPLLVGVGFLGFAVLRHRRISQLTEEHPYGETLTQLLARQKTETQKGPSSP